MALAFIRYRPESLTIAYDLSDLCIWLVSWCNQDPGLLTWSLSDIDQGRGHGGVVAHPPRSFQSQTGLPFSNLTGLTPVPPTFESPSVSDTLLSQPR